MPTVVYIYPRMWPITTRQNTPRNRLDWFDLLSTLTGLMLSKWALFSSHHTELFFFKGGKPFLPGSDRLQGSLTSVIGSIIDKQNQVKCTDTKG